jgi:acetyltransferase-like isoleucine patch superfamily enzyme
MKNPIFFMNEGTTLEIGAFCSIASGVKIFLGGEHRVDWVTTYPFNALWEQSSHFKGHPKSKGDVIIGNDVWIGFESVILSGIKIGDGAVVGTRSVVTQDIPPSAIIFGNCAKVLR